MHRDGARRSGEAASPIASTARRASGEKTMGNETARNSRRNSRFQTVTSRVGLHISVTRQIGRDRCRFFIQCTQNSCANNRKNTRVMYSNSLIFSHRRAVYPLAIPFFAKAVFSSVAKLFCKRILLIWSTKWNLFTKLFAQMGCKLRDESNNAN